MFTLYRPTIEIVFAKNSDGLYCHHANKIGMSLVDIITVPAEGYTVMQLHKKSKIKGKNRI